MIDQNIYTVLYLSTSKTDTYINVLLFLVFQISIELNVFK